MTHSAFILTLDQVGARDIGGAGGKGASLGEMLRAGLPIPRAFVVTTSAYQAFLDAAGLRPFVEECVVKRSPIVSSKKIQERFNSCTIPEGIVREISAAYCSLVPGGGPVAVRSSATAEDLPSASFAGQHDTYLNIRGEEIVLSHVRMCWSSLWTERAIAYREKNGVHHLRALMAVVVQEMVDADVSGVMFTANPVSGSREEVVIEACYGLGEALVSGRVTPDRFVVRKGPPMEVGGRVVGSKAVEVFLAPDGGTVEKEVSPERQGVLCLSDAELMELARLGARIEKHYGSPQDIEWCISQGKVFVLQSRLVTALDTAPGRDGVTVYFGSKKNEEALKGKLIVWSSWNVRETMPLPQTPFGWSFWNFVVLPMVFEHTMSIRRANPDFDRYFVLDRVEGRLYFNMNALLGMPFASLLGPLLRFMDMETASVIEELVRSGKIEPMKGPHRRRAYLGALKTLPAAILRLPHTLRELSAENARRVYEEVEREAVRLEDRDLSGMSDEEVFREAEALLGRTILKVWPTFIWYGLGFLGLLIIRVAVRKWPDMVPEKFLSGMMPPNKTTEMALEMWKLTEGVPEAVRRIFLENEADQVHGRLEGFPEGKESLGRLETFLDQYGHRGLMEFDITAPRWKDDPRFVLEMLRNYAQHRSGKPTPVEHFRRQADEREALIAGVRERLSRGVMARLFPFRRWLFEFGLRLLNGFYPIRENAKFYVMMTWQRAREMYMEVGRRFATKGVLEDEKDLFYLSFPEIGRISRGEWRDVAGMRRAIAERKAEMERWRASSPPLIIRSDGKRAGVDVKGTGDILQGSPVSPGRVTARAQVILDPSQRASMEKGDILVAPFTDPGWTPLFLTAGGLVMEIGGMMSHGAVVAREYGIPAVTGVTGATRTIRTGDLIEVDGSAGQVRVLERRAQAPWNNL